MAIESDILNTIIKFLESLDITKEADRTKLYLKVEETVNNGHEKEIRELLTAMILIQLENELLSCIREFENILKNG